MMMGQYDNNIMMGKYDENMMGKYNDDLTADHWLSSMAELMVPGFRKGKGNLQIEKTLQIEIFTLEETLLGGLDRLVLQRSKMMRSTF